MPAEIVASLAHVRTPLQLFRALLRECTYLPDPYSRKVLREHIVSRFRRYHPEQKAHDLQRHPPQRDDPHRQTTSLKKARRALSTLIRANMGDYRPLARVLMFTYHRSLKPRRELVAALAPAVLAPAVKLLGGGRGAASFASASSSPSASATARAPQQAVAAAVAAAKKAVAAPPDPQLPPKLRALLANQLHMQDILRLRKRVRRVDWTMPLNTWGRPMPRCRWKRILRERYRKMLEGLMPPPPEHEWYRLRDLVEAKETWPGTVPRRPRGVVVSGSGTDNGNGAGDDDDDGDGSSSIYRHKGLLTVDFLGNTLGKQQHRISPAEDSPHRITARLMRRLWGDVFRHCPLMRWNADRQKWDVTWGWRAFTKSGRAVACSARDRVFQGVDAEGKLDAESFQALQRQGPFWNR
jgi:hypothetical protein